VTSLLGLLAGYAIISRTEYALQSQSSSPNNDLTVASVQFSINVNYDIAGPPPNVIMVSCAHASLPNLKRRIGLSEEVRPTKVQP